MFFSEIASEKKWATANIWKQQIGPHFVDPTLEIYDEFLEEIIMSIPSYTIKYLILCWSVDVHMRTFCIVSFLYFFNLVLCILCLTLLLFFMYFLFYSIYKCVCCWSVLFGSVFEVMQEMKLLIGQANASHGLLVYIHIDTYLYIYIYMCI